MIYIVGTTRHLDVPHQHHSNSVFQILLQGGRGTGGVHLTSGISTTVTRCFKCYCRAVGVLAV